jgi:HEPN domain-containing protein
MNEYEQRKKKVVLRWLQKAESDIKVARHILEMDDPPTDAICFHCQQAIEKYLKAFLTCHDVQVKKTHDLGMLLEMCLEIDKEFESMDKGKIASLTPFAVEIRYPDEIYTPTIDESKNALETALKVKEIVFKKLNIEESSI